MAASERDVVVCRGGGEVFVAGRCRGRDELALAVARVTAAATTVTAAEELHRVGDDLDRLALGAVLGVPLTPVEASVDADAETLAELSRILRITDGVMRHLAVRRVEGSAPGPPPPEPDPVPARSVPEPAYADAESNTSSEEE